MLSQAGRQFPGFPGRWHSFTGRECALPDRQSQGGSSQASPEDSTLSLAESALSQAGSSQASLEENTLSPESELSQGGSPSSPEDSTQQAESTTPPQAVRHSVRLRARQAGNTSRDISKVSQQDTAVPQGVLPQDNASQESRVLSQ